MIGIERLEAALPAAMLYSWGEQGRLAAAATGVVTAAGESELIERVP